MYAVITLQDSNEVMVVTSNWLTSNKKQCYWPPFKSPERCKKAVEDKLHPTTEGKPWEILNICFHAEYATYEQAVEKQKAIKMQGQSMTFTGTPKKQAAEAFHRVTKSSSPLLPVSSQSAMSGTSSGLQINSAHSTMDRHGTKRKRDDESSVSNKRTSAQSLLATDMAIFVQTKEIMKEVKEKIEHTKNIDQSMIDNILELISKLDDIDKVNRKKATIGIIGKTGVGKSSLLNAVLGKKDLLPSGSLKACSAIITHVEGNLRDSNYIAEIDLISKEEWENEIKDIFSALEDKKEDGEVDVTHTDKEKIKALFGAHAEKKTLEELKSGDNFAQIDNLFSESKKIISKSNSSEFANAVARYIRNGVANPRSWYWPLVKSVTIKIPNCRELLEHIVLVDIPGTGDYNKIRNDLWKDKLGECSSVWIVNGIKRAIDDSVPWEILNHCIQELGPGGECKSINFIYTNTDEIDEDNYLSEVDLTEDQIPGDKDLKTRCILHRNNYAKEEVKEKLEDNSDFKKMRDKFITDVFTVSSTEFFKENTNLDPTETEIPTLQDVLRSINNNINRELTRDYVNGAKGILSLIQSYQMDRDEKMVEEKNNVQKELEENLEKALNELDCRLKSLYKVLDKCLSKGAKESVESCVHTITNKILSVTPEDKRGFHKTLLAVYRNKGCYWPKHWDAPLDLNKTLAKHMHENIAEEFDLIFPVNVNNETGMAVQEQIEKFSIIQSNTAHPKSSMLHHTENYIKAVETRLKAELNGKIVTLKKKIYSSMEKTIQNKMTAGYEKAAKMKGTGVMEKRHKYIMATIELLKEVMFNEARLEMLQLFNELKVEIIKNLDCGLKKSVKHSLSQTSKTSLLDVSSEIKELERLTEKLNEKH